MNRQGPANPERPVINPQAQAIQNHLNSLNSVLQELGINDFR